jgi:hypothetical protein
VPIGVLLVRKKIAFEGQVVANRRLYFAARRKTERRVRMTFEMLPTE